MTLNKNLTARGLWTLAQCALGFIATELANVSPAYAPLVAAALSFAKTFVADQIAAAKASNAPVDLDDVPGL